MKSEQISVGSVVQMTCGGPKMVVEGIRDTVCACVWFSEDRNGRWILNRYPVGISTLKVVK